MKLHELPMLDFQDQFVAKNVCKIPPIKFRKQIQGFQVPHMRNCAKVLLIMDAKLAVVCVRLPYQNFS